MNIESLMNENNGGWWANNLTNRVNDVTIGSWYKHLTNTPPPPGSSWCESVKICPPGPGLEPLGWWALCCYCPVNQSTQHRETFIATDITTRILNDIKRQGLIRDLVTNFIIEFMFCVCSDYHLLWKQIIAWIHDSILLLASKMKYLQSWFCGMLYWSTHVFVSDNQWLVSSLNATSC